MRKIIFLGSGTPTPTPEGFGTAFFMDIDGQRLMVDCGPSATQKLAQAGYGPLDVQALLFTHLHFDHCSGLPDLLLSYWDQSIQAELGLKLFGPQRLGRLVDKLIGPDGAYCDDIAARINVPISQKTYMNRGGSLPRPEPKYDVTELQGRQTFEIGKCKVTTRNVAHAGPWLKSLAYRFDFEGLSIVITGDTGSRQAVTELAKDCDLIVINAWNARASVSSSDDDQTLATIEAAATMAKDANAGQLVLSHLGKRSGQSGSKSAQECIDEASQIFKKPIRVAAEGDSVSFD